MLQEQVSWMVLVIQLIVVLATLLKEDIARMIQAWTKSMENITWLQMLFLPKQFNNLEAAVVHQIQQEEVE